MADSVFTKMDPRTFNHYAEQLKISWRWKDDSKNPGFIDDNEVRCVLKDQCGDRFIAGKPTDVLRKEAAYVAGFGQPVSSLQIMVDRWRDGDPTNNVPPDGCDDVPLGEERNECKSAIEDMFDPQRKDPGAYHGGDLKGVRDTVPLIDEMGFDSVWLSPLEENARGRAKGAGEWAEKNPITSYHGYWRRHTKDVNKHFGTWKDYTDLTNELRQQGIMTQLDLNLNHAGPRNETIDAGRLTDGTTTLDFNKEHEALGLKKNEYVTDPGRTKEGTTAFNHTPNISDWRNPPSSDCNYWEMLSKYTLAGLSDLNNDNPLVRGMIAASVDHWMENADGARIDTLRHIDRPDACSDGRSKNLVFEMADRIRGSKPGYTPIVGEWFGAMQSDDEFDAVLSLYAGKIDVFDFGFHDAVHGIFGWGNPLDKMHKYLKKYASLPINLQASLSPFVDNHDKPVLLNDGEWPTFEDLHQAYILLYQMRGIKYVYGQDLKYVYDHENHGGFFGVGGDPFNRGMVDPPVSAADLPMLKNPIQRLVQRLNEFGRKNMAILRSGVFKSGLKGLQTDNFGDKNVISIKRSFNGEEVLYIHIRPSKDDGQEFDADKKLQEIAVDFPPGTYEDPITTIRYKVNADGRIKPIPGEYADPVWKRWTYVTKTGRLHLDARSWTDDATGTTYQISKDTAAIPPDANQMAPNPTLPGRYRIKHKSGIQEPVDIEEGRIKLLPDHRTIVLTKSQSIVPGVITKRTSTTGTAGTGSVQPKQSR